MKNHQRQPHTSFFQERGTHSLSSSPQGVCAKNNKEEEVKTVATIFFFFFFLPPRGMLTMRLSTGQQHKKYELQKRPTIKGSQTAGLEPFPPLWKGEV